LLTLSQTQRRFMVFVAAVIAGFARNADLIRLSIAVPGNDHRLGACEAPPGIMSVYTGHQLAQHVEAVIGGGPLEGYQGSTMARVRSRGVVWRGV
jgi:glutamine synthetase